MNYLAEYRRYKRMYLELKANLPASIEERITESESESSDISTQHQTIMKNHQTLVSPDSKKETVKSKNAKKLRKIYHTLRKKGRVYGFYDGKPILADDTEKELINRLHVLVRHKSEKYNDQLVTTIRIKTIPKNIDKTVRGAICLTVTVYRVTVHSDGRSHIGEADNTHSSFRIFYNVDEIERFSFAKLKDIANGAIEKRFKNTMIGHYQYIEVEEILAKK